LPVELTIARHANPKFPLPFQPIVPLTWSFASATGRSTDYT
jgi:hypothetical protein